MDLHVELDIDAVEVWIEKRRKKHLMISYPCSYSYSVTHWIHSYLTTPAKERAAKADKSTNSVAKTCIFGSYCEICAPLSELK